MEHFGSITQFLEDKNVLVLGAAGFLAKSINLFVFYINKKLNVFCDICLIFLYGAICSFCGEDTKSATKCEESLSSFESCRC